jgi:hypothetical protein
MENNLHHSLIESYLSELSKKLQFLSKDERNLQVSEVKDHMYHILHEKTESGMNITQAAEDTLREFLPPEELAKGILSEEPENESFTNRGNALFSYGTMLTVGSLGGLSIPILQGDLNLGIILPFLLGLTAGIVLLNSKSIQWNENQLLNLKWISRILIGFLGIPLTFFSYRIIKDNAVSYTSLGYLIAILFIAAGIYLFLRKLFYSKRIESY